MNPGIETLISGHRSSETDIHVLCVAADASVQERLAAHLDAAQVRTVPSAQEALTRLRAADPPVDCLVSALQLPQTDCLTFLETVRAENPTLPFVLFTAQGSEALASKAISAGVTDYVRKDDPDAYEHLATRIPEAVAQARTRRTHEAAHAHFRALTDHSPFAVITIDETSTIRYANDTVSDLFGYDPTDLVGEPLTTLMPERLRDRHATALEWYLDTGERTLDWEWVEFPGRHKDGHEVPLGITFSEASYDNDRLFTAVLRDITDRTARREQLERRAAAMEAAMDGMAILNADDEYVYVNQAHADIYGFDSPAALVGDTWHHLYDDEEIRRFEEEIFPVIREEGRWRGEAIGRRRDGSTFPQELSLTALDAGGLVCVVRDITERKQRERDLEVLQRRYELVAQASTDAFWDWDPQTDEITRSEEYLRQFGYESADIGASVDWWKERIHPDDRDRVLAALEQAVSDPATHYDEAYRFQQRDGTYGYVRSRGYVVYNEQGEPERMVGAHIDITERKEREQAVEALHEATREMMQAPDRQAVADLAVETAKDVLGLSVNTLWVYEPDHDHLRPVAWTDEATEVVGDLPTFPADEVSLSWEVFESGAPQLFADLREHPERYNPATPIRSEIIVPVGDHGVMNIGATDPAVFDESDVVLARLLAANTRAALDRIETTEVLRERTEQVARQNRYLRQFYALTTDPETGFDTKLQDVLELGCEHFGFDIGVLVHLAGETGKIVETHAPGMPILPGDTFDLPTDVDALELVPPPDAEAAADGIAHATTAADDAAERFPLQDRLGFEAYLQVPVYVGEERYGLLVFGSPTPRAEPLASPALTLAKFVARWLNYELARQRIRRHLERQNDRLDEFASVVSHDLRNPLNAALGYVDLARAECESDHLDAVDRALDRMEALIADMLTLARHGQTVEAPESVALGRVVDRAWTTVAPDGELQVEVDDVTVMADPDRLQRVFENLFRNAAEHAGPAVTVCVGQLADGRGFYVADDGPGIPAADRDTVFEHGHTTSDDGTGFGLSIVRSIVEAHGWAIDVTESAAGGTRFEIIGVDSG